LWNLPENPRGDPSRSERGSVIMGRIARFARRTFLIGATVIAGGAAFGYYSYRKVADNPLKDNLAEGEVTFNPYVKITADNKITIIAPRAEMGQGIMTTLAALVAEELEVTLSQVTVEHGPTSGAYYNEALLNEGAPFPAFEHSMVQDSIRSVMGAMGKLLSLQVTGGSTSTVDAFEKMRHAGAMAREMLKALAAEELGVDAASLTVAGGSITDPKSGKSLTYGALSAKAAGLTPPNDIKLKDKADWKLLGKSQGRVDMRAKVTGAPIYGIDVVLPDMVFGTIKMNPRLGGRMKSFDAKAAQAIVGVIKVVEIDCQFGHGLGVIAKDTWTAFKAADALVVEWGDAPYPADTASIMRVIDDALAKGGGASLREVGDAATQFADAPRDKIVEATYSVPFLAHATMEPMNATAHFKDGKLEIWSPNQAPTVTRFICSSIAGLEQADVTVHTTMMGGGFGRRGEMDFSAYATLMAVAADGKPVKVIWTREEDMTHDMYRPAASAKFMARLGDDGLPVALDGMIATPSIMRSVIRRNMPSIGDAPLGPDKAITDGAFNQPYAIPNMSVRGIDVDMLIPVSFWRSVGNSSNAFFHECFMDEVAVAAKLDPVAMRLKLMADYPAAAKAIEKVAAMSSWGTNTPGHAKGLAFCLSFGGWVAQVVEVTDTPSGIKLTNLWCAADIGLALDPEIIKAQIVSGAIYGLSAAMNQEITFADGMVEQKTYFDFEPMRIQQAPKFHVEILENAPHMGGVGEIGTPPAAPALANAIFALNGKRIRTLPLSKEVTFA
jgi:isoquinoline 1-oxidoreductase subunit beta